MPTLIVILIAAVIAAIFFFESRKKRVSPAVGIKNQEADCPAAIADEALPTQTGRFKAQRVLKKAPIPLHSEQRKNQEEISQQNESEDEIPLPDPFSKD